MAEDPEAIALRIHQIAAVVGMLARGQEQNADPLSHALYLVEADLLDVETRLESLRKPSGETPERQTGHQQPDRRESPRRPLANRAGR